LKFLTYLLKCQSSLTKLLDQFNRTLAVAVVLLLAHSTITTAYAAEKLVILGSSTAAGIGASSAETSWGGLFKKWAKVNRDLDVINLASPGALTQEAACTTRYSMTQKAFDLGAQYIIVSYPSNDTVAGVAPDQTIENIRSILQCASARGVKVILLSTLPRSGLTSQQRKSIVQIDDTLKAEVGGCFIDLKSQLSDPSGLNPRLNFSAGDGIHVNNNGHATIFLLVRNFLMQNSRCI
jgi:acyl-CoA thioesterase-1